MINDIVFCNNVKSLITRVHIAHWVKRVYHVQGLVPGAAPGFDSCLWSFAACLLPISCLSHFTYLNEATKGQKNNFKKEKSLINAFKVEMVSPISTWEYLKHQIRELAIKQSEENKRLRLQKEI